MPARFLGRRSALLLPLLFAACGGPPPSYAPLRYDYLPPIRLNVAQVEVRQEFFPSGLPPDVSASDPAPPVTTLSQMLTDRLKAFGPAGRAVAIIQDASLTQQGDTISGSMAVRVNIYTTGASPVAFAEARVSQRHTGHVGDLRETLYNMTKQMMDGMNVELEYQIRRSLKDWLVAAGGPQAPVQQQPLTAAPGAPPTVPAAPGLAPPVPLQAPPPPPAPVPGAMPPSSVPPPIPLRQ
jgi:hypothetical protein